VTWRVTQLLNSHAAPFLNRAARHSVQLCREKAVNADCSVLVYATKLQCATRHVTLAILLLHKVVRQNRTIESQVWRRSNTPLPVDWSLKWSVSVRNGWMVDSWSVEYESHFSGWITLHVEFLNETFNDSLKYYNVVWYTCVMLKFHWKLAFLTRFITFVKNLTCFVGAHHIVFKELLDLLDVTQHIETGC